MVTTPGEMLAACFDIGGTFIKFGASDDFGQITEIGRIANPIHSFELFLAALRAAMQQMPGETTISMSLAGTFDPASGLATIANVKCLHGRRVAQEVAQALGCQVTITNDADCFALAEAHSGIAKGKSIVFGIILGSGVGGGIVIDGKLLRGFGGIAGEWGHGPTVDPTAGGISKAFPPQVCECGQVGCLDKIGSARGLEFLHHHLHGQTLQSFDVTENWKRGQHESVQTITVFVEHIARCLSVVVNTLGPDLVPVGGGLAAETALVALLDKKLRSYILAKHDTALVVPGLHASDGGLKGAALVAMRVR